MMFRGEAEVGRKDIESRQNHGETFHRHPCPRAATFSRFFEEEFQQKNYIICLIYLCIFCFRQFIIIYKTILQLLLCYWFVFPLQTTVQILCLPLYSTRSLNMVLDYSKWDALELSDDSDIEVHPNVDKKSFIRAKQNQIHQERFQRRHEIETLKYERIINDGLLKRIDALISALKKHEDSSRDPDELVFQALIESAGDPKEDQPPTPPEGVYTHQQEQPKYSQMMGSLVDQVKKELDEKKPESRFQGFITGVGGHRTKVLDLQQELLKKLAELEKLETSKITSENLHMGFDSSFVSKQKPLEENETAKTKEANVELLNPGSVNKAGAEAVSSGAEADVEEAQDDENIKVTPLAKDFAKVKLGDYKSSLQFISDNPGIVTERKTDELLMEAFDAQLAGKDEYARQCVHQGLLLQYCRSLGRDGVGLFFKRYANLLLSWSMLIC